MSPHGYRMQNAWECRMRPTHSEGLRGLYARCSAHSAFRVLRRSQISWPWVAAFTS